MDDKESPDKSGGGENMDIRESKPQFFKTTRRKKNGRRWSPVKLERPPETRLFLKFHEI